MHASAPCCRTNFREPTLDIPFQFVGVADYAPYTFRRTTFMDIGGLDEGASEPGQCGIISDWEVSTRVWLAGWQVGYMHVPVSQDSAQGGWRQLVCNAVQRGTVWCW